MALYGCKHILCMDFDGVIHSYESGWKGADVIPDNPVEGAFEFLEEATKQFAVAIYSARSGQEGGIDAMKKWFTDHGFSELSHLDFPKTKPPAFVSIDDRCLTFNGTFPSIDELKNFMPWNKKGV